MTMIGDGSLATKLNMTKELLHVRGCMWDSDSIKSRHCQRRKFRNTCVRRNVNFECSKMWLFHITAQMLFWQGSNVVVS